MLKRFASLFGGGPAEPLTAAPDTVHMATCVLMLEAARADNDFSDDERRHILSVLRQRFELTPEEAEELLEQAMTVHDESTSLHQFTREINTAFSVAEKVRIVEEIWRIFYADKYLDGHEDHLAAKLRNLLNLSHPVMIDAKMRVLAEIRGGN
ncbi:MAG: TerB family tellurite resistance protein [Candidatus Hydrogenedentes bacterium]|nr:TerB family tellurite resistance protein [Candidatus Hydrogenedentota bacterium]